MSSTDAVARHLATSPEFEGIGFARASRLAEAFGEKLASVLGSGDPTPLVPILGADLATSLIEAWRTNLARGDVVVWLSENGFDPRLATRAVDLWGAEAARIVSENPYSLMAFESFRKIDAVAMRLGWRPEHAFRMAAAVEDVLYRRLDAGHTWIADDHLRNDVAATIGQDLSSYAVGIAADDGAAFALGDGWQSAGCAAMEDYVAARLRTMVATPPSGDLVARRVDPGEIATFLNDWTSRHRLSLDEDQARAVRVATTERIAIVTGGAGVGKTTVLKAIGAACDTFGRTTVMVALAGRAAMRITETTGRPAMTIAAFLKKRSAGDMPMGAETLLVVDEASMLDLPTLYRILRAMPDEARLLLVGDPGQLPPIGFGLTLHVLAGIPIIPKVELTRVYRQTGRSGIPAISRAVREGRIEMPPAFDGLGTGVSVVACHPERIKDTVVDLAAEIGGIGGDLRILSAVRSPAWGTESLNGTFHRIVSGGRPAWHGFCVGEPVMYLRNDYQRGLRNGSLGVVTAIGETGMVCDFGDGPEQFTTSDRANLSLAYAMTVHKAQGSQFPRVIVPVVASRILDRSLIYTAITRASEQVVLVGDPNVLEKAVRDDPVASRRLVGLGSRLVGDPRNR
ncbi:AAA family ATPase [Aureimonas sp. SK2]|uniref:AAA family ATPase n=1 Tax=Aureimonas sp. SK2 TaxID=3015992 RepID=UPI00244429F3|nr:AAA family ATPase [Aureimonas sp. SK2]